MNMVTTQVTVYVAKETKDVCDFALKAVNLAKAKQPLAELLPDLVKAVDGLANIPAEAKTQTWAFVNTLVLFGVNLAQALVSDSVETVPAKV
ncbi:MAG: hypothetical protein HC841_00230 [Verrucomicrobiae bacterium]|nr:hypothetical protein [Verrucomicrobiae bacterium]